MLHFEDAVSKKLIAEITAKSGKLQVTLTGDPADRSQLSKNNIKPSILFYE